MPLQVHAEVEYQTETEQYGKHSVHSDICPPDCDLSNITEEYRKYLHDNLDEWLDKSNGTGIFYITGETKKYFPNADRVSELEYELKKLILKFDLDKNIL